MSTAPTPLASSSPNARAPRRRFRLLALAPVFALLALLSWAVASPVGSSPDDDFHLVSIWCASPGSAEACLPGTSEQNRIVPPSLVQASCFSFDPDKSAQCQSGLDFTAVPSELTTRGNFFGAYPPLFYSAMGLFAGHDITASVLLMRLVNIVLFVAMATALFLLLPATRRPALIWGWALTMIPLGLFILTSNNPSSWAIMGVGFGWISLLGFFESSDDPRVRWRKVALGLLVVLSALMAAGSRGDAAIYTVLGIVAVGILTATRSRRFLLHALLPLGVVILCVLMYRFSRPVSTVTGGIPTRPTDLAGSLLNNLLEVPSLWMGVLGREWGLGWLDTSMPAVVWLVGLACFMGVGMVALGRMSPRKLLVLIGGVLVLLFLPAIVVVAAGNNVGENMQPRYLLPLVVLFTGVLMLTPVGMPWRLSRPQALLVASALSLTHLICLHLELQRYVSGFDKLGWNLDANVEWWWPLPISPMGVWLLGSASFAALLFVLVRYLWREFPPAEELSVSRENPALSAAG